MTKNPIIMYCDGACLGNPGPGGYAALLIHNGLKKTEKIIYGSKDNTTNNAMELMAVIYGLGALKKKCQVAVFSDSKYVLDGISKWSLNWVKNNFLNAKKKPIANKQLWEELILLAAEHEISWHWVKGHSGDPLNERVDSIAREQATKLMVGRST